MTQAVVWRGRMDFGRIESSEGKNAEKCSREAQPAFLSHQDRGRKLKLAATKNIPGPRALAES